MHGEIIAATKAYSKMDAIAIEGLKPIGKDDSDPELCIYDAETTTEVGNLKEKACERCGVIGFVGRHGHPPVTLLGQSDARQAHSAADRSPTLSLW